MSRLGDSFTRKAGEGVVNNARYDITWTDGITIIILWEDRHGFATSVYDYYLCHSYIRCLGMFSGCRAGLGLCFWALYIDIYGFRASGLRTGTGSGECQWRTSEEEIVMY